jgi:hypothetical protein
MTQDETRQALIEWQSDPWVKYIAFKFFHAELYWKLQAFRVGEMRSINLNVR